MNKSELSIALTKAKNVDYPEGTEIDIFDGYGLDGFKPVYADLNMIARLIAWQCIRFDGSIDSEELDSIARIGRKSFLII